MDVTVVTKHVDTETGDIVEVNQVVTIKAGDFIPKDAQGNEITITVDANTDDLNEANEEYKVKITDTEDGGFENVVIGAPVTTTILDNTTPQDPTVNAKAIRGDEDAGSDNPSEGIPLDIEITSILDQSVTTTILDIPLGVKIYTFESGSAVELQASIQSVTYDDGQGGTITEDRMAITGLTEAQAESLKLVPSEDSDDNFTLNLFSTATTGGGATNIGILKDFHVTVNAVADESSAVYEQSTGAENNASWVNKIEIKLSEIKSTDEDQSESVTAILKVATAEHSAMSFGGHWQGNDGYETIDGVKYTKYNLSTEEVDAINDGSKILEVNVKDRNWSGQIDMQLETITTEINGGDSKSSTDNFTVDVLPTVDAHSISDDRAIEDNR